MCLWMGVCTWVQVPKDAELSGPPRLESQVQLELWAVRVSYRNECLLEELYVLLTTEPWRQLP